MENLTPAPQPSKKGSTKSHVPQRAIDRSNLGVTAANFWATQPQITLVYITQAEFAAKATTYQTSVVNRIETDQTRPQITSRMRVLDKEFNLRATNIKSYVIDKYGKDVATNYYAEFGITRTGKSWKLPADRNTRVVALKSLLKALTTHGFQNNTYGKVWWNARISEYATLVAQAGNNDSTTSGIVGTKNALGLEIKDVLDSLVLVIKANYKKTYKTVLREWGFQKEKF